MLFGLANAPSSFQNFNNILEKIILDLFITIYVNNILVFSKTFHKYRKHVKTILTCFLAVGLQLDINKCKFEVHKTKHLNLIIQSDSLDGCPECVKMYLPKTSAKDFWESP